MPALLAQFKIPPRHPGLKSVVQFVMQQLRIQQRPDYEALVLFPADSINDLAVVHIGTIYGDAGDLNRAPQHFRQAAQLFEEAGDLYRAAETRRNMAIALSIVNRRADALEYAKAVLRDSRATGRGRRR